QTIDIAAFDPRLAEGADASGAGSLTAPMPGLILAVHVKPGDPVEPGDALASLEAMKMEHTISAPFAGTVKNVRFSPGEQVKDGDLLFDIEASG
ncbi:MAG: acetyl-CoA carboxylase biotin carboxyl carrier protein subunit, partial [Pseudomonadota bacterium]